MGNNNIQIRLRIIIIKEGKLLCSYSNKHDFYFYVGGHMELGETIEEGCKREIVEECGEGTEFKLIKILYTVDFFDIEHNEQNVELFILGDINKFEELEHRLDPQHIDNSMWITWLDINKLPDNLYPKELTKLLLRDYENNFLDAGQYIGKTL